MTEIVDIGLWRFETPLTSPLEVRPGFVLENRECLLIAVRDASGRTGWGEAAPLPGFSRESMDAVVSAAVELAHRVRSHGFQSQSAGEMLDMLPAAPELPSLEFAFDTAVGALRGGDRKEGRVRIARLLQGDRDSILRGAEAAARLGFRTLKVKVGRQPVQDDIALLTSLRTAAGPQMRIRADANRSWSDSEAVRFASRVAHLDLEFVEEPLRDPDTIADFVRETGMPVALDETLTAFRGESEVDVPESVVAVVVKPTLLGSRLTRMIGEAVRSTDVRFVASTCYEGGIGTAAVLRTALAVGDAALDAGAGTWMWLAGDCLESPLDFGRPWIDHGEMSSATLRPALDRLQPVDTG